MFLDYFKFHWLFQCCFKKKTNTALIGSCSVSTSIHCVPLRPASLLCKCRSLRGSKWAPAYSYATTKRQCLPFCRRGNLVIALLTSCWCVSLPKKTTTEISCFAQVVIKFRVPLLGRKKIEKNVGYTCTIHMIYCICAFSGLHVLFSSNSKLWSHFSKDNWSGDIEISFMFSY